MWDVLVVDCAPTAETCGCLRSRGTRLGHRPGAAGGAARSQGVQAGALPAAGDPMPGDPFFDGIERLPIPDPARLHRGQGHHESRVPRRRRRAWRTTRVQAQARGMARCHGLVRRTHAADLGPSRRRAGRTRATARPGADGVLRRRPARSRSRTRTDGVRSLPGGKVLSMSLPTRTAYVSCARVTSS